jgi:predicted metal-binding protein
LDISNLLKIFYISIKKNAIKFTQKTKLWCCLPYPDHPNGCPNFDKNPLCPPKAPFLKNKLNKFNYFYLIIGRFNLSKYKEEMLIRHPSWSEKQAKCVLYWQSSAKRHIKDYIERIYEKNSNRSFFLLSSGSGFKNIRIPQEKIYSMEAVGINVFKTLDNNNIEYELKPEKIILLVNLICSNKKLKF